MAKFASVTRCQVLVADACSWAAGIDVFVGARDLNKSEAAAAVLRARGCRRQGLGLDVTSAADIFNAAYVLERRGRGGWIF
jgi:hypothetical protein